MGVRFDLWLARDTELPNVSTTLWWKRYFYPDIYTLIDDLYKRGLIEEGDYIINIDW